MFKLATSYLTITDAVSSFSFLKQPCQKDTFCSRGKDVNRIQKGQIIGMLQAKKTLG